MILGKCQLDLSNVQEWNLETTVSTQANLFGSVLSMSFINAAWFIKRKIKERDKNLEMF